MYVPSGKQYPQENILFFALFFAVAHHRREGSDLPGGEIFAQFSYSFES